MLKIIDIPSFLVHKVIKLKTYLLEFLFRYIIFRKKNFCLKVKNLQGGGAIWKTGVSIVIGCFLSGTKTHKDCENMILKRIFKFQKPNFYLCII